MGRAIPVDALDDRARAAPTARLIERVMVLDAVLDDPEWTWLASERDKMRHFQARLSDYRTESRDYPHLAFRSGTGETPRFFPDKLPIGVDRLERWRRLAGRQGFGRASREPVRRAAARP